MLGDLLLMVGLSFLKGVRGRDAPSRRGSATDPVLPSEGSLENPFHLSFMMMERAKLPSIECCCLKGKTKGVEQHSRVSTFLGSISAKV